MSLGHVLNSGRHSAVCEVLDLDPEYFFATDEELLELVAFCRELPFSAREALCVEQEEFEDFADEDEP